MTRRGSCAGRISISSRAGRTRSRPNSGPSLRPVFSTSKCVSWTIQALVGWSGLSPKCCRASTLDHGMRIEPEFRHSPSGNGPRRVLFVFAWLVVGGEETEVRLLAKHLDPARYRLDVVSCLQRPGMPEQTHEQLAALGIEVDRTPYQLSFEETVAYLIRQLPTYDLVVACQAVPDVYPALERCPHGPALIEHGGLVAEALI